MSRLSGNTKKVSVYGRKTQSRVVNRQTAFTVLSDDDNDPFGFFQSRKADESVDTSLSFQSATSSLSIGSSREVEAFVEVCAKSQPLQVSKAANVAPVSTPKASKTTKRSNVGSPATVRKPRKTVAKPKTTASPRKAPLESTPPPAPAVDRAPRRAAQAAKMAIEDYDFTDRDMTPRRPVPTKSYFVEKAIQLAEWAREDAEEQQAIVAGHVSVEIPIQPKSSMTSRKSMAAKPVSKPRRDEFASDTSTSSAITVSDSSIVADSSQSLYSQPTSDDAMLPSVKSKKAKSHADKRVTRRIVRTSDDEADSDSEPSSEDEDPTMQLVKSVSRMSIASTRNSTPGVTELLQTLCQSAPESFDKLIAKLRSSETRTLRRVEKLGEASYSEVFTLAPASPSDETLVMKVIPITMDAAGSIDDDDRPDTSPARDIQQEVQIMQLLGSQSSSAFVSLDSAYVVRGEYPAQLLKAWDRWDAKRNAKHGQGAENIRPSMFDSTQLYAVLLMSDGGPDLESFKVKTWTQAAAIFWQVTAGLAEMEHKYAFEHRDLHWGNILVRTTEPDSANAANDGAFWLDVSACGVRATIIDFTLSRATLPPAKRSGGKQRQVIAYAFEDDSIFQGHGDAQYDVYRQMRDVTRGDWAASHPLTNVLWLRYLIHKLIYDKAQRLKSPSPVGADAEARREWHSWRCLHSIAQILGEGPAGKQTAPVAGRKSVFGAARKSVAPSARKSLAPAAIRTAALQTSVRSATNLMEKMKEIALL